MLSLRARWRWACIEVFVPVAVFVAITVPIAVCVLAGRALISRRSLRSCGPGRWSGGAPANQQQQRERTCN